MHRVHFRKEDVTIDVPEGTNLRQACLDAGIDPYPALGGLLSCRGKGICGTCVVQVDPASSLGDLDRRETKFLKRLSPELADVLRLSCRGTVCGEVIVETDPNMKDGWRQHGYYSGRYVPSWKTDS